jgi:hypothetical protein
MKLRYLLIGLALTTVGLHADVADKKNAPKIEAKSDAKSLSVSDTQVTYMREIMERIVHGGKVSGLEELFKIINGQTQTTDRELPVQAAITEATEKDLRIMCYQEGSETVVASTDPSLLGKPASDFKTAEGKVVRDLAIEELRKSENSEAIFTYVVQPKGDEPLVNGKPVTRGRIIVAKGRQAFPFLSDKRFLCTAGAKISAG